jgi:protocatechuate 3,4-dioxygenase beta subunit
VGISLTLCCTETLIFPADVNGELIRSDMREDQQGVELYADVQVIDVNTCTPLPNVYLDFWHCNSTGVYLPHHFISFRSQELT